MLCDYRQAMVRREQVRVIIAATREALHELYGGTLDEAEMRHAKALLFAELEAAYQTLRRDWPDPRAFDAWFAPGNNNARMAALATYDEYLPAFAALLRAENDDMSAFYRRAAELGQLSPANREQRMSVLLAAAVSAPPPADSCPERPSTSAQSDNWSN